MYEIESVKDDARAKPTAYKMKLLRMKKPCSLRALWILYRANTSNSESIVVLWLGEYDKPLARLLLHRNYRRHHRQIKLYELLKRRHISLRFWRVIVLLRIRLTWIISDDILDWPHYYTLPRNLMKRRASFRIWIGFRHKNRIGSKSNTGTNDHDGFIDGV